MTARISAGLPPLSARHRALLVSLIVHAGLVGLLAISATRAPIAPNVPIRMRLMEPPPPPASPPAAPRPAPLQGAERKAAPPTGQQPEARLEAKRAERSGSSERPAPAGPPQAPPRPEPPASPAPPAAGTRAVPERPIAPPEPRGPAVDIPRQTAPEAPRDTAPPVRPERGGLSLGGPSEAMPSLKSPPSAPGDGAAPRRSFRDQIASLGSRLGVEDAPAKQTVHLDTQEPRFLDYLARVKRRIERVWTYPEEAWGNGISGELLLIFTLNKAGTLTSIRLVHSSGFPVLDQEALRAVKTAAPYDPFPPQLGEDPWNIAASFHYNLPPRRFRRN